MLLWIHLDRSYHSQDYRIMNYSIILICFHIPGYQRFMFYFINSRLIWTILWFDWVVLLLLLLIVVSYWKTISQYFTLRLWLVKKFNIQFFWMQFLLFTLSSHLYAFICICVWKSAAFRLSWKLFCFQEMSNDFDWFEISDPGTQKFLYANIKTGKCHWRKPEGVSMYTQFKRNHIST